MPKKTISIDEEIYNAIKRSAEEMGESIGFVAEAILIKAYCSHKMAVSDCVNDLRDHKDRLFESLRSTKA